MGLERYSETDDFLYETSSEKQKQSLPETNFFFAPENGWLEDEFLFGMAYFQGLCSF